MPTNPQIESPFFTRLPTEIRDAIYDYCAVWNYENSLTAYEPVRHEKLNDISDLLLVCKAMAIEFQSIAARYIIIPYGPNGSGIDTWTPGIIRSFLFAQTPVQHVYIKWYQYGFSKAPYGLENALSGSLASVRTLRIDFNNRGWMRSAKQIDLIEPYAEQLLDLCHAFPSLKGVDLMGYYRTKWMDEMAKKLPPQVKLHRGRPYRISRDHDKDPVELGEFRGREMLGIARTAPKAAP